MKKNSNLLGNKRDFYRFEIYVIWTTSLHIKLNYCKFARFGISGYNGKHKKHELPSTEIDIL